MPTLPRFPWRYLPLLGCLGVVGCLSFSLEFGSGRRSVETTTPSGVLVQSGKIKVGRGQIRRVYYPVPYHNIPHLSFHWFWSSDADDTTLLIQERDYFEVRAEHCDIEFTWTAKGLPITVALPAPPTVVITPPPVPPPSATPPNPQPLPPTTP